MGNNTVLKKNDVIANLAWSNCSEHPEKGTIPKNCTWIHLDMDTPVNVIKKWKDSNYHVSAYVSTGSFENWRSDAKDFPEKTIGCNYDGWPGEKWIEIYHWERLKPVMTARFEMCKKKGFEMIEIDNCECASHSIKLKNNKSEQNKYSIAYHTWLAQLAHKLDMLIAWKNTLWLIPYIVDIFDACFNEEAIYYKETEKLEHFYKKNKPVWVFEYKKIPQTYKIPQYLSAVFFDTKNGWIQQF